jgi:hypothetical protein
MGASPAEQQRRRQSVEWYMARAAGHNANDGGPYFCPCCGCRTLPERGGYAICPVCFWEDDGQDNHDADVVRGGPNGALSLTQARRNYQLFGACEERFTENVRPPRPQELAGPLLE